MAQRRGRARGESRRAEILDAALRIFLRSGYKGATIDLVVSEANASKATVYSYFGGKEGLFISILEERTEHVLSDLFAQDMIDPHAIGAADVPGVLEQIARRLLTASLAPEALGIYRLVLSEGRHFPEVARTFYRLGPDRARRRLARILTTWREHGWIVVDDPDRTARHFLTIALGDLHLRGVAGLLPDDLDAAIDDHVKEALAFFWTIVGWTPPPA
ncbi:TetR/AcrR family transcriptional regulator [Roseospira marina]|uniref:TetR/AcrR family transcriptional regulator n=1 Tax=Roseospira marina TaxID=140057 RepID=A0A5M6I725_9PROT|nr:TetR/AcrR family transcriptional regulator [Roseospira marina]KAA5604070.1 TetR/AcrR family transcriptional regulator [Roseospira marina]MBB4315866.1 AcrR family transcriptional regulator [Roseospira marina]MBB5088994.1 AcrR family transcriptional regulator [Roseospira marina]